MKRLIALAFTLGCVFALVGCGGGMENKTESGDSDDGAVMLEFENNELSSGRGWYGDLPKGLRPMLLVNNKLYRWTGMSREYQLRDGYEVYTVADSTTILPEGYAAAGEISGITEDVPLAEFQLRAGFDATGTIFVNAETPEVIYALMTTDWFDNYYIRFVSDDLHDNESLFYQGQQYRISGNIDVCEMVEELPEECAVIGNLRYIGSDHVPANDLETNCICDSYSHFLDGREVYADPDDQGKLYVYEHQYWAEGDYPAWRVCKLWTESVE